MATDVPPASPAPPGPPAAGRPHPWSARPLAGALAESGTIGALLARVRESERRLTVAAAALPPGLAALVRAGPLDDQAWLLLAEHASAAAKLRQCVPAIEAALAAQGIVGPAVKIKIRPRG
jgi:hypothetical protein